MQIFIKITRIHGQTEGRTDRQKVIPSQRYNKQYVYLFPFKVLQTSTQSHNTLYQSGGVGYKNASFNIRNSSIC